MSAKKFASPSLTRNEFPLSGLSEMPGRTSSVETLQALKKRKKYAVRERIQRLIDPGTEFLELSAGAAWEVYPSVPAGAGIVTGIATIAGNPVMVVANDCTVKGGTYFPLTIKKHLRAQQVALENALPCLYLVDSGGVYLPLQDQVFPDREHFGRIFFNQAQLSRRGIPQISLVLGSCTAGGAYVPAMSDQTVLVRGNATIFLGGPPLVKAATGHEVSAEELGGADVHCRKSGLGDYLAESEAEALELGRGILARLGAVPQRRLPDRAAVAPKHAASAIENLIPKSPRVRFPMRDLLLRFVDNSEFDEFKANYAETLITCFAFWNGYLVGILANDGVLFGESALKAAHFIELCSQRDIPLVFLQNITGFMVGKEYEHAGIAKDGAKLVNAVACAPVPKYTVILGGSFGAGNYGMCGRAFDPQFLFSWPRSQTAVMGSEQATSVLQQLKGSEARADDLREKFSEQAHAYYGSARLWDDGVIAPSQTRAVIAACLSLAPCRASTNSTYGVFRF